MFFGGGKTVLLVDDDEMVREFAARCLAKAEWNVIKAANGQEALRLFNERSEEIHLVISDMVMPGLFGDQLAARLWESQPSLPVIFISGNPPENIHPAVTLECGKNFLRKPFTVAELFDVLRDRIGAVSA